MLTDREKNEIEAELERYDQKRAASVEALKIVQRERGWITDEVLIETAELLDMSPAELDSVATFYNLIYRRPVGKHVIMICDSVTCWIMGYDMVRTHLEGSLNILLGGTTADNLFTLLPVACLGACDKAPAMMIDDTLYTHLSPERIDEIIGTYRQGEKV